MRKGTRAALNRTAVLAELEAAEAEYHAVREAREAMGAQAWSAFVDAVMAGDLAAIRAADGLAHTVRQPTVLSAEGTLARDLQRKAAVVWWTDDAPESVERFDTLRALDQRGAAAFERRYAAREAAGLNPRTGESMAAQRQREHREAGGQLPDEGHYPDLLSDRPNGCSRIDEGFDRSDGSILHTRCNVSSTGSMHHLRYFVGGRAVAGITLAVNRSKTATIDRVFTAEGHRRQGYASALLEYAKAYFPRVKHSTTLTAAGRAWKTRVERLAAHYARRITHGPRWR